MGYGRRPDGVTVLVILQILMVVGCLLIVGVLALVNSITDNPDFQDALDQTGIDQETWDEVSSWLVPYALLYAAFALVYALLAYTFFVGREWGWWLGIYFAIILIVFNIVMFILTPSLGGLPMLIVQVVVTVVIFLYINSTAVVTWFKGPEGKGVIEPPRWF